MFHFVILLFLLGFSKCQEEEDEAFYPHNDNDIYVSTDGRKTRRLFIDVHYVVNMDSQMETCDEESLLWVDTSGVNVGRYNETVAFMHGDIVFMQDVGENTMVEIILNKEASGNKYELMFSHEICDLCAEVQKGEDSDYYSYIKYFGIPDTCPFPAADYPIKELVVDTDDMPVNSNTAGRYQAFLKFYKNPEKDCKTKEKMFCLTLKLLIEID